MKFNARGRIMSTCRMASLPEGLDHPYMDLATGESVLEAEPKEAFEPISCLEIHQQYKVDVREKKLVPQEEGREGESPPQTGRKKSRKSRG